MPPDNEGKTENIWNKSNTFNIYYISSLDDTSATSETANLIDYLKVADTKCTLSVIERTDVTNYSKSDKCYNPTTDISFNSRRFCKFIPYSYTTDDILGATLVIDHKLSYVESPKIAKDCYFHFLPVQTNAIEGTNKIEIPFAYIRFTSADQIESASDIMQKYNQNNYKAMIIGSVKTELFDALKKKMAVSPSLILSKISDSDDNYTIFLAARSNYVLRELKVETIKGKLRSHIISIEKIG